jgi:hypothetical protein
MESVPKKFYEKLLNRLNPVETENLLNYNNEFVLGVTNHNKSVFYENNLLALGKFKEIEDKFFKINSGFPDGVAAIIRFDEEYNFEILTNQLASRTIWYYKDDEQFIVSTSQRMIINILGNYKHSDNASSWFMSSGNLGPGNSWDSRIKHLNYDSSILLNRAEWNLDLSEPKELKIGNNKKNDKKDFLKIIEKSFAETDLKSTKNVLTLSGGYDSRLVLELLKDNNIDFTAMTWGTNASLYFKDTDTAVAKKVAKKKGVELVFHGVDSDVSDFDLFMKKFVEAGEARIDHLSNYLDNFKMWEQFSRNGKEMVIRSDEVFGWLPVSSKKNIRLLMEMNYLNDFDNFKKIEFYGMKNNLFPASYLKKDDESLYSYRDRLFNTYRQTFVQSALHDLFYAYSEMVNPLFADEIVQFCRNLNDKERTNKSFYLDTIRDKIDYMQTATRPSYPSRENVLKSKAAYQYFNKILLDKKVEKYVSKSLIDKIQSGLTQNEDAKVKLNSTWKTSISKAIPTFIKNQIRRRRKFNLDYNLMAFRVVLIMKWVNLIDNDLKDNKL